MVHAYVWVSGGELVVAATIEIPFGTRYSGTIANAEVLCGG